MDLHGFVWYRIPKALAQFEIVETTSSIPVKKTKLVGKEAVWLFNQHWFWLFLTVLLEDELEGPQQIILLWRPALSQL